MLRDYRKNRFSHKLLTIRGAINSCFCQNEHNGDNSVIIDCKFHYLFASTVLKKKSAIEHNKSSGIRSSTPTRALIFQQKEEICHLINA